MILELDRRDHPLTVGVVLDEDGDLLGRLGQLVGGLLRRGRPQVRAVVLQDLSRKITFFQALNSY